jgi:hypothetical protein
MFARSSTLGLLAAVALSLPSDSATEFTLRSSGAVSLSVTGTEARYGLASEMVKGKPVLVISLGATGGEGTLLLYTAGDVMPRIGRHPIYFSWQHEGVVGEGRWFHACFIAGTPERPLGVFHGESGWVTITAVEAGRMSGRFEVRARGFLAADTTNEDQWVTVHGTFTADGDSTVAALGGSGEALSAAGS